MNSVSGYLRLSLPKTRSAEFEVESFSGDIFSALGKVVKEKCGPFQSLVASLGYRKSRANLNPMSAEALIGLQ